MHSGSLVIVAWGMAVAILVGLLIFALVPGVIGYLSYKTPGGILGYG
jgi:hypothetical protein